LAEEDRLLPSSNSGIESEGNKKLSGILLIRHHPQSLLLEIHIVPDGDRLLMLDVRGRDWGRGHVAVRIAVGPRDPMVVIERRRQRHGHRRRWGRMVVSGVLIVLLRWIVCARVLRRVRSGGGEHVAVRCRLRRLSRRRVMWKRGRVVVVDGIMISTTAAGAAYVSHRRRA